MAYAVVFFCEESQYSEVPRTWLSPCESKCFWPPGNPKNISNLIRNNAKPEADWILYEVEVDGYFNTLEKARKRASNRDYASSQDEAKGRGKRKKIFINSSSDEDSSRDSITPPPALSLVNAEIIWEEPVSQSSKEIDENKEKIPDIEHTEEMDQTSALRGISPVLPVEDVPLHSSETIPADATSEMKLDKILRMLSHITEQLVDLNRRIDNIEKRANPQKYQYFRDNLPCDTRAQVEDLDNYLLADKSNQLEFAEFIQSIGGMHQKDKVNRIMKTLFTNQFGTLCSWLGQRNNLRASDFLCVKIARDSSASALQLADFEKHSSEWFRLSKLRLSREK